jgi:hypothetical protein
MTKEKYKYVQKIIMRIILITFNNRQYAEDTMPPAPTPRTPPHIPVWPEVLRDPRSLQHLNHSIHKPLKEINDTNFHQVNNLEVLH